MVLSSYFFLRDVNNDRTQPQIIDIPCENFRRRVDNVLVANGVVANVDFRVATVEHKIVAELRDLNVAVVDSLHGKAIGGGFKRVILCVSGNVELRLISGRGCDSDVPVIRKLKGGVETVGGQVGRRNVEEVGLKFDFAILLAPNLSLFGDLRTVVVGGEAFCVTKVAPIGATVCLD